MSDIETVHENVDGEQITTKRVPHQGDVYEFEGEPGGEFEYVGDSPLDGAVVTALQEHLGDGESVVDEPVDVLDAQPELRTDADVDEAE